MKSALFFILLLVLIHGVSIADNSGNSYNNRNAFLYAPSSVYYDGLLGFANDEGQRVIRGFSKLIFFVKSQVHFLQVLSHGPPFSKAFEKVCILMSSASFSFLVRTS